MILVSRLFSTSLLFSVALVLIVTVSMLWSAAPPLRTQLDLSGEWTGGTVPQRFSRDTPIYERKVTLPTDWAGKQVELYLEQWNYGGQVFVDGVLDTTLWGGFIPFHINITDRVSPGKPFTLKLVTREPRAPGMVDASGKFLWPMGGEWWTGLRGDVFVRAFGEVCIENAFIQTSVRNGTLTVEYMLVNHSGSPQTVAVEGEISPAAGGAVVKTVSAGTIVLAKGERRTVKVSIAWPDAKLWQPGTPFLYHLVSRVKRSGSAIDEETRRFGFREVWIEGNQYRLNGVRMNLRGESSYFHWPVIHYDWYDKGTEEAFFGKANFAATVDTFMKVLNMNMYRFHGMPAFSYNLDICDEKGLLVQDESPMFGLQNTYNHSNGILNNVRDKIIGPWIRAHRNHPSVVLWSAENEGFLWDISNAEMKSLGDRIRVYDSTRPVLYDGDPGVVDETKTYHYPEGYGKIPSGSIYSWANKVDPAHPTGVGEFITCYAPSGKYRNAEASRVWAQVLWTRGLRYTNFADIRPYTLEWAWTDKLFPEARRAVSNSYAAVALFDKDYDNLGIGPLKDGTYPTVDEGSNINRTLILYNDEFTDSVVAIEVALKSGTKTFATATRSFKLSPGSHVDIPCGFQVPYVGGNEFDLVLRTFKGGKERFVETKRFRVKGTGIGTSSSIITITGGSVSLISKGPSLVNPPRSAPDGTSGSFFNLQGKALHDLHKDQVFFRDGSTGAEIHSPAIGIVGPRVER